MADVVYSMPGHAEAGAESDLALLRRFAAAGDEAAFAVLVGRHAPRVLATARRVVRDPARSEDVAQAVFLVLARKAPGLADNTVLPAWLHAVTFLAARSAVRSDARRRRHERRAAEMATHNPTASPPSPADAVRADEVLGQLDAALAELRASDRDAVVLRYIEGRPPADVARVLGVSEAAASKRVGRALAKLRGLLARRGVRVADAAVASLLAAPPPHVTDAVVNKLSAAVLTAAKGAAAAGAGASLAKGVTAVTAWTKGQIAAVAAAVVLLAGGGAALVYSLRSPPTAPVVAAATPTGAAQPAPGVVPAPTPADQAAAARLPKAIHTDASSTGLPYAPGWPLAVPGGVMSTPSIADLDGDGKPEVLVTCAARQGAAYSSTSGYFKHPSPSPLPLLYAFRADGSTAPGFPVSVGGKLGSPWAASPSVYRGEDGRDRIVLQGPRGAGVVFVEPDGGKRTMPGGDSSASVPLADLDGDGVMDFSVNKLVASVNGQPVSGWPASRRFKNGYAPCVGDALGDGRPRLFHLFYTNANSPYADVVGFDATGTRMPGWPKQIDDASWLAPVMGDIAGDGKMEVVASYGSHVFAWNADGTPVAGTTTDGPLVGVLRPGVSAVSSCPALADLDGDGKAEVILFDQRSRAIRAFHGDGRPVGDKTAPDVVLRQPDVQQNMWMTDDVGVINGPPTTGVAASTRATLPAGRFELAGEQRVNGGPGTVVILPAMPSRPDPAASTTRPSSGPVPGTLAVPTPGAVTGADAPQGVTTSRRAAATPPGTGWFGRIATSIGGGVVEAAEEAGAATPIDGVIAVLPGMAHGVSVVSLGDDPAVFDFFAGTFWVRRLPDGTTTTTNMLPAAAETEWTQPTVTDLDNDGLADVVFGLSDGRVFVYQTKLAYHEPRMQWPTANGNFQHTGAWAKPKTTK